MYLVYNISKKIDFPCFSIANNFICCNWKFSKRKRKSTNEYFCQLIQNQAEVIFQKIQTVNLNDLICVFNYKKKIHFILAYAVCGYMHTYIHTYICMFAINLL